MLTTLDMSQEAAWRRHFRVPQVVWSKIATQNPAHGVVCSDRSGTFQLYAWDRANQTMQQLTDHEAGVLQGAISADGQWVYYLHDTQGNEIGHYFRVSFDGRQIHDLTADLPAYASYYITESFTGNMIGFMMVNQNGFQFYVVENATRAIYFTYQTEHLSQGPLLSHNGELAAIATTERNGGVNFNLELYNVADGSPFDDLHDGPGTSITPAGFAQKAGDLRLLANSNQSGVNRPFIYDPSSKARTWLQVASLPGDVQAQDWSEDAERVLLLHTWQAQTQLYLYHLGDHSLTKLDHPAGTYAFYPPYFGPNNQIYTHWTDATHPLRLITLDGATGQKAGDVITVMDDEPGHPWQSITFTSFDNTQVQAWLAKPAGDGPFPTILHVHGGPTDVQMNEYHAGSQVWVQHGFAFCSVNYRGSTTFGKDFEEVILGDIGQREVEDIAAGAQYLVDTGIAKADKLFVTGASYGGYLTLLALARKPHLWAGGMALVAIADWSLTYAEQSEPLQQYLHSLFGGSPHEKPEQYKAASVLTYADDIVAPLLIVQGRNDPRTPEAQMQAFIDKMQALGKGPGMSVHWFDAAQDPRALYQREDQQAQMLEFVYAQVFAGD